MTIQEVIKSGKPFKKESDDTWISPYLQYGQETMLTSLTYVGSDQRVRLQIKDIIATNWEIKNDRVR